MYGGSTTSILMNIPGEASSVVTCIDGFAMTKKGRAGEALAIAAIASFIAGTGGVLLLTLAGPAIADVALLFGPSEQFGLVLFSLATIIAFSGVELSKGLLAGLLGILLASVGLDPLSGKERLVFGSPELLSGLDVIPILMGLFGVAEVMSGAEEKIASIYQGKLGRLIPRGRELKNGLFASLRGTGIGLVTGLIPGMNAAITTFISYDIEKRVSRTPERFGQGAIEGVASPEANNNAVTMSGFIPLFVFGIPTMPTFAILLSVLMIFGLSPGPMLFSQHGEFTWTVIASMYIGNVMLLIFNLPLVGLWARISLIPYRILGPVILGISFIGAYSLRNNMFDVWTTVFFGLIGFAMKKRGWPLPPLILGFILGPMLETELRASLQLSDGSLSIFFTRPITLGFVILAAAISAMSIRGLFKAKPAAMSEPAAAHPEKNG
jgi:putative tricarboxylic transport membrane protein